MPQKPKPKKLRISIFNPPKLPKFSPRWAKREVARLPDLAREDRALVYKGFVLPFHNPGNRGERYAVEHLKSRLGDTFPVVGDATRNIFSEWKITMGKIAARGYRSLPLNEACFATMMVRLCRWYPEMKRQAEMERAARRAKKRAKIRGKRKSGEPIQRLLRKIAQQEARERLKNK